MTGLRERKKRLTHQAIVRAAFDLFSEQGYERTSVTQIAEVAMVSPATFFTYFPSKEDVVFADYHARTTAVASLLRTRRAGESVPGLLRRALGEILTIGLGDDLDEDLHRIRGEVVLASTDLRAAAVGRLFASARTWGEALAEAAPEISDVKARALIGSTLGASILVVEDGLGAGNNDITALVRLALDETLGRSGDAGPRHPATGDQR